MRRQGVWIAVILLVTGAANGLLYFFKRQAPSPAPLAALPRESAPATRTEETRAGLARAHRAAGLAALEDRDYVRALTEFEAASQSAPDPSELDDLKRIARDLLERRRPSAPEPEAVAARERAPAPAPKRAAGARPPAEEREIAPTLLLITTTPPGLAIQVDGRPADLTPARVPVTAGTHEVELFHGEQRLYREQVEVPPQASRLINRDFTAELAPRTVAAAEPATAGGPEPHAEPTPLTPAEPVQGSPTPAAASTTGELDVVAPGLFGEVWINGRSYGYAPLTARNLPVGPAQIEIRVHGAVKRAARVDVPAAGRAVATVR